jgi:tyrosyl-tRNA synthetase
VVLRKMRQFQDLGHRAVLIIGDYTARVGDPSGQNVTRPILDEETIRTNAATYLQQASKVLDTSPDHLETRRNSEWLGALTFADVIRLASQMTVARMMERDTFEIRYAAGAPIGIHEFLYPLMQGHDSVSIEADVELGGTDQTFNNLVGRQLQERAGQPPQIVMVLPILVGLDGTEKMSKSKGNHIGVLFEPADMYGKVMSIPDALMENYLTLLTDLPVERIDELLDGERTHPRDAKAELARLIVTEFHDARAAAAAAAEFDRVHGSGGGGLPDDMPTLVLEARPTGIVELIVEAGFAASKSAARRLVQQKAVSIDDEKLTEIEAQVTPRSGQVLRVGKRRFARLEIAGAPPAGDTPGAREMEP